MAKVSSGGGVFRAILWNFLDFYFIRGTRR